jgi:hypothetical protein
MSDAAAAGLGHQIHMCWIGGVLSVTPRSNGCGFSARAENRLDETRTDALVPQPETGKISCVHRPHYGRLSPSAYKR